jgi:hypothetical protein
LKCCEKKGLMRFSSPQVPGNELHYSAPNISLNSHQNSHESPTFTGFDTQDGAMFYLEVKASPRRHRDRPSAPNASMPSDGPD